MRKILPRVCAAGLLLFAAAVLHAGTVKLPFPEDGFVTTANPNGSYGKRKQLQLGFIGRYRMDICLGGLRGLWTRLTGQSGWRVKLHLYQTYSGTSKKTKVAVYAISGSWQEERLKGRNAPAVQGGPLASFTVGSGSGRRRVGRGWWYTVDLTRGLKKISMKSGRFGLRLKPRGRRGVSYPFAAHEFKQQFRPWLEITAPGLPDLDLRNKKTSGTTQQSQITRGKMVAFYPEHDVWLDQAHPGRKHGNGKGWSLNGRPGPAALFLGFRGRYRQEVLLKQFGLNKVPDGTKIHRAYLKLYMVYSGSARRIPVSVREITSSWDEGSVTWQKRPDYSSTQYGRTKLQGILLHRDAEKGKGRWVRWDVTRLVRKWVRSGENRNGVVLYPEGRSGVERRFDCRESSGKMRPRLEIFVPKSSSLKASKPAGDVKQVQGRGKAPWPKMYSWSAAKKRALLNAVRKVQGENPDARSYRRPEGGRKVDLGRINHTPRDIKKLKRVMRILQRKKDIESLWLLATVGKKRPEILLVFLRSGKNIWDTIETMIHELTHAGSGAMTPFLRPAHFRAKARRKKVRRYRGYSFFIDNEVIGLAAPARMPARSLVYRSLPASLRRSGMAKVYLTGRSGRQGPLTLLDELNAYTRGLRCRLALGALPRRTVPGQRLAEVLAFTGIYFQQLQRRSPSRYRQLVQKVPEIGLVLRRLESNARKLLRSLPDRRVLRTTGWRYAQRSRPALQRFYRDTGAKDPGKKPLSWLPRSHRLRQLLIIGY